MSFDQAQAGLYNAMREGLGLSGDTFQIIQPTPPLVAGNDQFLWMPQAYRRCSPART
jgi:hypothetical protein